MSGEWNLITSVPMELMCHEKSEITPYLQEERIDYHKLNSAQIHFAAENFDRCFNEDIFPADYRNSLKDNVEDIFDRIYLNGQSLNDLYQEKYKDLPYYIAQEAMKCEFMQSVAAGRKPEVMLPGMDHAVPVITSTKEDLLRPMIHDNHLISFSDEVRNSRELLGFRTEEELEWKTAVQKKEESDLKREAAVYTAQEESKKIIQTLRNHNDSSLEELGKQAYDYSLLRDGHALSLAFAMVNHNKTMREILDADQETLYTYGDELIKFMQDHQMFREGQTVEERTEAAAAYGRMYKEIYSRMLKETIPYHDPSDPFEAAKYQHLALCFKVAAKGLFQSQSGFNTIPGFQEAWESPESYKKDINQLEDVSFLYNLFWTSTTSDKIIPSKVAARIMSQQMMQHKQGYDPDQPFSVWKPDDRIVYWVSSSTKKLENRIMKIINCMDDDESFRDLYQKYEAFINWTGPLPDDPVMNEIIEDIEKDWQKIDFSTKIPLPVVNTEEAVSQYQVYQNKTSFSNIQQLHSIMTETLRPDVEKNSDAFKKYTAAKFRAGNLIDNIASNIPHNIDHPVYQDAGFQYEHDLFYIDGIPAFEYAKKMYPDLEEIRARDFEALRSSARDSHFKMVYDDLVNLAIANAVLNGNPPVDFVRITENENGSYQVALTGITMDHEILRRQMAEKNLQLPPQKAPLSPEDDLARREALRNEISAQVMGKLMEKTRARVETRDAFQQSMERFGKDSRNLEKQYFGNTAYRKNVVLKDMAGAGKLPETADHGTMTIIAALSLMAENPNVRYADLSDPSKFAAEKQKAGEKVYAAFHAYLKDPQTGKEDVKTIMKEAMGVLSGMNVRKELLYALGEDPSMTDEKKIQEIFASAKNFPVVNGFYASLADQTAYLNRAVFSNGAEELIPPADGKEYKDYLKADHAFRMLQVSNDFLSYTDEYMSGTRADEAGMASALSDYTLLSQINQIVASRESVNSFPSEEMKAMFSEQSQLRDQIRAIGLQKNFNMNMLMNKQVDQRTLDCLYQRVSYQAVITSRSFFPDEDFNTYSQIGREAGIKGFGRVTTDLSMAFMMGLSQGFTFDQMMNPDEKELRLRIGRDTINFLTANKTADIKGYPLSDDIRAASLRAYGDLFKKAGEQFTKEAMPAFDINDPLKSLKDYRKFKCINLMGIDYTQLKQNLKNSSEFIEGFGGKELHERYDAMIDNACLMGLFATDSIDLTVERDQRLLSGLMAKEHMNRFAGREIAFAPISNEEAMKIKEDQIRASQFIPYLKPEDKDALERMIFQNGPIPKIDGLLQYMPSIAKRADDRNRYKEEKIPKEPLKGVFRKDREPGRYFSILSNESGIHNLNRDGDRRSLALMYTMAKTDKSLSEVMKMDQETLYQYSDQFLQEVEAHKAMEKGLTIEQKTEIGQFYGKMYKDMADALYKEKLPVTDYKSASQMADHAAYMTLLNHALKDFVQTNLNLHDYPGFTDAFGGRENFNAVQDKLDFAAKQMNRMDTIHSDDKPLQKRLADLSALDRFGVSFMGKTIADTENSARINDVMDFCLSASEDYFKHLNEINANGTPEEKEAAERSYENLLHYINCDTDRSFVPYYEALLDQHILEKEKEHDLKQDPSRITLDEVRENRLFEIEPRFITRAFDAEQAARIMNGALPSGNGDPLNNFTDNILTGLIMDSSRMIDHPAYQNTGMKTPYDLIYIDGVKLEDHFDSLHDVSQIKGNYPDGFKMGQKNLYCDHLKRELMRVLLRGEAHVDILHVGMDPETKTYKPDISEIRIDHDALMEKAQNVGVTLPRCLPISQTAEERQMRQNKLTDSLSLAMYQNAMKQLNAAEAAKNDPYIDARERFDSNGPKVNGQYFGPTFDTKLAIMKERSKGTGLTFNEDHTLLRNCAQLVLLAENPQIHYADLMDPEKFQKEKMDMGNQVADAFLSYLRGPVAEGDQEYMKPALNMMFKAMSAISNMNVKEEILYALGEDPKLSNPDEVKEIMSRKENLAKVNGILTGINKFAETAAESMDKQPRVPKIVISTICSAPEEEYATFVHSSAALKSFDADENFSDLARDFMMGKVMDEKQMKEAVTQAAVMESIRDLVANTGKASDFRKEDIMGLSEKEAALRDNLDLSSLKQAPSMSDLMAGQMKEDVREAVRAAAPAAPVQEAVRDNIQKAVRTQMDLEDVTEKEYGKQKPDPDEKQKEQMKEERKKGTRKKARGFSF